MSPWISSSGGLGSDQMSWHNVLGASVVLMALASAIPAHARLTEGETNATSAETEQPSPAVPAKVEVAPVTLDKDIAARLERILETTNRFESPRVEVDEGVVFLAGRTKSEEYRSWAEKLATKTEAVVAVVNRIEVVERSMWDLSPAWNEVRELSAEAILNLPLFGVALIVLVLTWYAAKTSIWLARRILRRNIRSQLLRDVTSRAIAVPVFLIGLYLVLKVSGLSRLAVTVLGGTGLVGLVLGFAFRDIAENFLASILISIQHPFAGGDLIQVAGHKGFVQSVNTRSTLLMTLEGNHIQIPNATIYKETITNFTANPNERFDFVVGIGYDDSISEAQAIALKMLQDHRAVVDEPEPFVLVESLGAATVNLRAYFWVDIARFSSYKVISEVTRLTKTAFDEAGISMPDEAREVVFPDGVPVEMLSDDSARQRTPVIRKPHLSDKTSAPDSIEGDLASEAADIQRQAQRARVPESGQNLLDT